MLSLPLKPAEAIPISGPFSWASDGVTVFYFADPEPFDSHPAEDTRALRMRIAKFCCTSGVRIVDLERAFEMSLSTVKRAVKLYAAEGEEGFRKPLRRPGAGPRRRAVTPEAARRAGKMLSEGMSRRACALELGIHPAAFNDNLRAGVIREPAVSAPRSPGRTERDRRDKRTGTVRACRDVERRRPAAAGLLVEASPRFDEAAPAVAGGGALTALPALLKEGLLDPAHRLFRLPGGFYGLSAVLLLTAFMILARMRAPEALRHKAPGEQGVLLGLDRCPEVKTLRRKIAQLAASEDTVRDWQRALSRSWLAGEESGRMTLAVDGHVKTYSGRKGRPPRHFIAR